MGGQRAVVTDGSSKNKEKNETMIKKTMLVGVCILLVVPAFAWAADISGKWKGEAPGSEGNVELTLTFKVEGTKLTGTLDNPEVGSADIKEGKVEGETVSFHLDRNVNGMDMKIVWKGTIEGDDEIKFKRTWEMGGGFGGGAAGGAQSGGGSSGNDITMKRAK